MKALIVILCLTILFSSAWSQTETDFESQKGLLTCPLAKSESVNQHVVAVYGGEVIAVLHNKGFNTAIMIRHGNYYAVYSGLDQASVTKGMLIDKNQEIGTLLSADDAKFHFELWSSSNGKKKRPVQMNSQEWVTCLN